MDVHLFATDASGLELGRCLPAEDGLTAVIVPINRSGSAKVEALAAAAAGQGLPVFEHPLRARLPGDLPSADAGLSWLYSQIIHAEDLGRYPAGLLNMHGGKIPEYRGANVLNWAIINGEEELGVTWHGIVEEVDAGPIWAESSVPIPPRATAMDVRGAMIAEGQRLFRDAWARFAAGGPPVRLPNLARGTIWPSRRPRDGQVDPGWPERRLRDTVRALCPPWPPAVLETPGGPFAIATVEEVPAEDALAYRTAEGRMVYLRPAAPERSR